MKIKQVLERLICFCITICLLLQTSLIPGVTLGASAAQISTTTEFIDGREVIRITGDNPKENPYGVGKDDRSSLGLFMNILRNNPNAYIIMETDINIRNDNYTVKIIPRNAAERVDTFSGYSLFPEVDTFNGVLDGNGHTITNLQLSCTNLGSSASSNVGMIHTLGESGIIKNLTLNAPLIDREVRMGTVIGAGGFLAYDNKGVIENCKLKNVYVNLCGDANGVSSETYLTGGADNFGGFSAENNGTIRDCRVEGMTILVPDWDKKGTSTQPTGFGGIANTNSGTIENCILTGLRLNAKVACHERGKNFTNFGGAVGVNTGTVSNVHVEYNLKALADRWVGDPGSLYYVQNDPDNGMYQWFTDNYSPTVFGRVIGSNNGTYLGLTSILYDANNAVYTIPESEPRRNRMIGNDNGSTAGNSETTPYDISVTFSQADVTKNGDVYDAKFSVLSGENATAYYKLSDTAVTDTATLESNGTAAALSANTSSTLTLSGLGAGKTYTCYVAAKKADNKWSDIKSFTVITPKKSPALVLKNPSESLSREYSGSAVNHMQELFSWQGGGELTFSYYYYKGYSAGVVKTTTANSGAASEGAPPVNVAPGAADTYYLKATLSSSGEYDGASITIPFNITQAETKFDGGIQVYLNDTLQTAPYNFTYGDKLTVKVKPAIAGASGGSTVKATGNMTLYAGSTQLSDTVSAPDENGYYTLAYDTVAKKVLPGDLTLTVKYAGSNEMKPLNGDTNIKLNKRTIAFTANDPICNIEYTGETTFTHDLYDKYRTVQPPCLLAADNKMLNINGTVTVPSPNAGNYSSGFTTENLKLVAGINGDVTAYYSLDTDSVKNGYAVIRQKSVATSSLTYNIDVLVGESNFEEPKYEPIQEKGTFSYTYNGTSITYQEIKDKLAGLAEGSTLSVDYKSILDNVNSNYTGFYMGRINFKVTSVLFKGVNEAMSIHPLENLIYGVTWGELFAFDASKVSCTGIGGKNVPGTCTLLTNGVPFDAAAYPRVGITNEYKVLFNSEDGTIKDLQIASIKFIVRARFVEVECLNPVFICKPGVTQNPELKIKNKVGNDNVTARMWSSGNSQPGEYEYRILLEGNDANQYTDYRYINDQGEYVKVSYKIIGLNVSGTLTPKASPTYGDTWNDILPLTQNTFSAMSSDGKAVTGTYRLQVKRAGTDYSDVIGTDIPNLGDYNYRVIFSCDTFGDTIVASGYLGVQKREIRLEWSNTQFTYNGKNQAPTATITNKVGNDDVGVTVYGYAEVGTHIALVPSTLTGADKDKYKLSDPLPTQSYSIIKAPQNALTINQVTAKKYGDGSFDLQTTGGSGTGDVTYSVPENNGVLKIISPSAFILNAGKVIVTATRAGDNNYNAATATLEITIDKADAPILTFPKASGITYGQKLSASTLTGGSTEYGTFAWTDSNTVPTVKNSGYEVTFTPNAATQKNYKEVKPSTVAITVSRAAPTVAVDGFKSSTGALLTATVTGIDGCAVPAGTVKFVNSTDSGDVDIAGATTVAVTGGKAIFEWTGPAGQIDKVKAVYNGDDNYGIATTPAVSLKIDQTPPTGKITVGATAWEKFLTVITFGFYHVDPNTVTIESSDSESGVKTTQYLIADEGTTYTQEQLAAKVDGWQDYNAGSKPALTEGQKSVVYAKIMNNEGLVTYLSSDGMILDNTAPTVTVKIGDNSWTQSPNKITFDRIFNKAQTATITAADSGSGIASVQYQLVHNQSDYNENGTWTDYPSSGIILNQDDKYIVYAKITDKVGNYVIINSDGIIVDQTKPELTLSVPSGWQTGDTMTVGVTTSDMLAGLKNVSYTTNESKAQSGTVSLTDGSGSITLADEGTYNLTVTATDNAGNSILQTALIQWDKTKPTITVSGNPEKTTQSAKLSIAAMAGVSGIKSVMVSEPQGDKDITGTYQDGYSVTQNGTYTFTVTNNAGVSVSSFPVVVTNIDTAKPVVVIDSNGTTDGAWTKNDVTLNVTNSTANLGTTTYEYSTDGTNWSPLTGGSITDSAEGVTTYSFRATSGGGVVSDVKTFTVKIDKTAPAVMNIGFQQNPFNTVVHFVTFGLFFGETVDVNFTADDLSGVDHYEYQIVAEGGTFDVNGTWQIGSLSIAPDFKGTVYARAVDKVGNVSSYTTKSFVVDKTVPVITANLGSSTLNTLDENTSIPVAVKDNGAGVGTVSYQVNGGKAQTVDLTADSYSDLTKEYTFHIGSLPDGAYDVTVNAQDNSGNAATTATVHVVKNAVQIDFGFASATLDKTYGDAPFTVAAAGGQSDGTVSYAVTDGADVLSVDTATGKVTIQKAGTAVITSTKAAGGGYLQATAKLTVNVAKAAPTVQTLPTASNITVIGKLSSCKLSGGKASVPGTFSWTAPDTVITKSGNYEVTFTPADLDNYAPVSTKVAVAISPILDGNGANAPQLDCTNVTLPAGVTSVSLGSNVQSSENSTCLVVEKLIGEDRSLGDLTGLTVYDLKLLDQDGNPIEHFTGKIKVKLPIPSGMSGELKIFWYNPADGTLTDMNAVQENGYLVFETTHFSYYAIAQLKSSNTSSNTSSSTSSDTSSSANSSTSSDTGSGTTENPKTGSGWPIIPLVVFGGSAVTGAALIKRRKIFRRKKSNV